MEIKNKQLELDENEQIIDILKAGATDNFKKEKAEKDRQSKEKIKEMDVLSKVSIEELKVTSQEDREGLDALVKMAVEQTKKETKNGNEEG
jgi:Zn-dependent metalloprotease